MMHAPMSTLVRDPNTGALVEREMPSLYPLVRHSASRPVSLPAPVKGVGAARVKRETERSSELRARALGPRKLRF